ncbi:MAG: TRAP transporter fused permease subunit [Nitrospinota bacterium]|jgi:TRAP transporter 4TM/12TM fusion protein|nr:TRAP transporter fused permease subunit [Nitrospinota bacterium]
MATAGGDFQETSPDIGRSHASRLTGAWKWFYQIMAVALGLFALWSAGPGIPEDNFHLGFYTLVTWILSFLLYPGRKGSPWIPPSGADLALAAGFSVLIAYTILRADSVSEDGARLTDWIGWLAAAAIAIFSFRRSQVINFALMGLAIVCLGYFVQNYLDLQDRTGAWTPTDFWMALLAICLSLEAARRGLSIWIPSIAVFALLYAHFGSYFPGQISHRGSTIHQIVNYTFYSQEGIFGVMTSVMATYVLIFIYLGAFMNRSGMGQFFIDMPLALAGRTAGGPAKVAVLASAIFGSISGSSIANIVSTGTFTIPLMKKVGFRPHVAGAVENSASLGGQLLPPVMGSGAFVMAEITGVPYVKIMAMAAFPALLYLFSIGIIVHLEAKRNGISGMADEDLQTPMKVFREGWFHLLPLMILLVFLIAGFSPDLCAAVAIVSIIGINWVRMGLAHYVPDSFVSPKEKMGLRGIFDSLVDGTENSLIVGSAAASVGIIVGMVALTGLGLKMSYLLVELSGGSLLFAIFMVAVASLVLGMALPITASYLVLVVLAGPALESLGVPLIAAHMIVFWLSQDSNITPPVCLGAYVAASIAGADPWKTGWMSFRFAKMLYVIPLLFAYTPILLTGSAKLAVWVMVAAVVGTIAFSAWTMGYFLRRTSIVEWLALGVAAFMCFIPGNFILQGGISGYAVNLAGAALLGVVCLWQWRSPAAAVPA